MTGPAITFDTGALIALERRKERAMKVFARARDMGFVVATPNVTVAGWWRGRTDRRESVLKGLVVELPTDAGSFPRCGCSGFEERRSAS